MCAKWEIFFAFIYLVLKTEIRYVTDPALILVCPYTKFSNLIFSQSFSYQHYLELQNQIPKHKYSYYSSNYLINQLYIVVFAFGFMIRNHQILLFEIPQNWFAILIFPLVHSVQSSKLHHKISNPRAVIIALRILR